MTALTYSAIRFTEAYGLWRERRWAEWLSAVSGAIYLPFEIYELAGGITPLKFDIMRSAGVRCVAAGRSVLGEADIRRAASEIVRYWGER